MSSHELPETCKFGHVFQVHDHDNEAHGPGGAEMDAIRNGIRSGRIRDLEDLEKELGTDFLRPIMGDHYKKLQVGSASQGVPYMLSWVCADKLNEDNYYTVHKTQEHIYVSPQSNLHGEFTQRKQQAEQNVRETMRNVSELVKQKHMLEHDVRKLRSRAEDFGTGDETTLKADFIELVDGAGGAGQQGGDEASLKFYRDNNIYPSIVADFNEMDGVDDLKDGKLSDLPSNEKAILRKKYTMYEKWKDLYGSEINRKLKDLKSQLKSIERSIQETKEWVEPYVQDLTTIHHKTKDAMKEEITGKYYSLTGTSSLFRDIEFIAYRPMKNQGGELQVIDDEDEATHFRIVYIHSIHLNFATPEQPQTPAEGPSSAVVFWFPAVVCRHVFQNIFQQKIKRRGQEFEELVKDYTGELETGEGEKLRKARESKNLAVRDLRQRIGEELGEEPPLELSSFIRRVEDGLDRPGIIEEEFGEKYLTSLVNVLEVDLEKEERNEPEMYTGFNGKLRRALGQVDPYVIPEEANPMDQLLLEMKFKYYYDLKLSFGLHTMK